MIASGAAVALPTGTPAATVGLFVGLLLASFFFSGSETAFFSLQERDRRRMEDDASPEAERVLRLLSRPTDLISTILIGNETANVLISSTAAALAAVLAPTQPWISVVLVTPTLILFSEITPKVLAFRYNRRWAEAAAFPLAVLAFVLAPVRWVVHGVVTLVARALGLPAETPRPAIGEDEFLVLVEQGAHQGVVDEDAREIIEAVFELDDVPVARVMTPRPDVFSLSIDLPWAELLEACREARYSRVPIWEDDPDNVVGVLLIKDLLRHRRHPLVGKEALRALLVPPAFVPSTKPVAECMREMLTRRIHMSFVADEYGTIMGIVALDDLIGELVGEIGDDDDDDEPSPEVVPDGDGWVVQAWLDVDTFAEATGHALPSGGWHTVAGFVFHTLGRIPRPGDAFEADGLSFRVDAMEGRRVSVVRIAPIASPDLPAPEAEA